MARDVILKKLPMPKKPMLEQEADDDLEDLLAADEAAPDAEEVEPLDEETPAEEAAELDDIADDVLIAELRRRGLIDE